MSDQEDLIGIECPFCSSVFKVERQFVLKSDRLCCQDCNKAFEISSYMKIKLENKQYEDIF